MKESEPDPSEPKAMHKLQATLQEIEREYPPTEQERETAGRRRRHKRYAFSFFLFIVSFVSLGGITPADFHPNEADPNGFPLISPLPPWPTAIGALIVAGAYLYYTRLEERVEKELSLVTALWKRYRLILLISVPVALVAIQYVRFGLRTAAIMAGLFVALLILGWFDKRYVS